MQGTGCKDKCRHSPAPCLQPPPAEVHTLGDGWQAVEQTPELCTQMVALAAAHRHIAKRPDLLGVVAPRNAVDGVAGSR
jgi:hypothetical protein